MIDHGKTQSTIRPDPLNIDEYSVWAASNITPIEETIDGETFAGWEYNLIQYEKDEYIKMMAVQSTELGNQLTDTQLALCDIYEGMV